MPYIFAITESVKRKNFNVIAKAKRSGASSALLETCFIDSSSDVSTYKSNVDSICQAICEGIAEGFGLKRGTSQPSQPIPKNVDASSLQGVDYVQGDWGHLLNGAGWVCLDYCSRI